VNPPADFFAPPDPSVFVIFGGTGDLSRRKLIPALAHLAAEGHLGRCHVIGVSPKGDIDDDDYRRLTAEALAAADVPPEKARHLCTRCLHFQSIGAGEAEDYLALRRRIEELEGDHGLPGNRAFYLAVPPRAFPPIIDGLGLAGLSRSAGWTRLVVEKPFGRDLDSARTLNAKIHEHFEEDQVYRIDHYLGKDTVQNLLVLRFANTLFESSWNRERVHSVQITVAEELGVGTRAGYYDHSGALRDMVQNHISQLLTLVAMEPPVTFDASAIRYEKIKVLRSIAPIGEEDVVRARYSPGVIDGEPVRGYLEEERVDQASNIETFVALKVGVNNWRWKGVPFYLRTGKRMPRRLSQIAVRFQDVPVRLFQKMGVPVSNTDVLVIELQPEEGFRLFFDVKAPGKPFSLQRVPLSFRYDQAFNRIPDAYQTLLLDVLTGDQTLFVHSDEVEESWRVFGALLDDPAPLANYPAGTWGPKQADHLALPEGLTWLDA
jgi:glucose-6-phosphate 1-dehydrogenase